MGNPAYDARRASEQAEYEKAKASDEAIKSAFEAMAAFMNGHAYIQLGKGMSGETIITIGRR